MIKFKDYQKSTKLTDMDRKNFVIHNNMETLQNLSKEVLCYNRKKKEKEC